MNRNALGRWLIALALVMFVVMPTFDRLACAGEPTYDVVVAAGDVQSGGGEKGDAHVPTHLCTHGHCHHGGAFAMMAEASPHQPSVEVAVLGLVSGDPPLSYRTSGPERPPRG